LVLQPKIECDQKGFARTVFGQPKHAQKPSSTDFCGLTAAIEMRRYGLEGCISSCPVLNKVKPDNMDTAQTIFDRMVRVACGFESLHVRDDALSFFTSRPRVHDMRVSISVRGANRKTSRRDFFACFG
jgi:hypothetical protein